MSSTGSPKTPKPPFRKPTPNTALRNATQSSHMEERTPSPSQPSKYRTYSPGLISETSKEVSSEINANEDQERAGGLREVHPFPEHEDEVQVPAVNPSHRGVLQTPLPQPREFSRSSSSRSLHPSEQATSPADTDEGDASYDLEDFDMADFQKRYYKALSAIVKDEAELVADFDRFADCFAIWARSASARDTDRASKRLKTREMYVNIAENTLAEKVAHYDNVVQAFQNAMALLR